jgi:hypothetical protein
VDPALQNTEVSQDQSPAVLPGTTVGKSTMEIIEKLHQDFDKEVPQMCSKEPHKDPNMGPYRHLKRIRLQGLLHVQVLHRLNG